MARAMRESVEDAGAAKIEEAILSALGAIEALPPVTPASRARHVHRRNTLDARRRSGRRRDAARRLTEMCGRFTRLLAWSQIHRLYRLTAPAETGRNTEPRYNIAPTEDVLFVTAGENGDHKLREGRWWLVPWWATEMPKAAMFNARSEEVDRKPAFRDAFNSKRCLIPADGFCEWTKSPADAGRDPWYFHLPEHAPFSFAGVLAYNQTFGITSCTIITAPAVDPVNKIHDRMPVILDQSAYDAWLDPTTLGAKSLLIQNLDGELKFYRVGRAVNATKGGVDEAWLIEPFNPL